MIGWRESNTYKETNVVADWLAKWVIKLQIGMHMLPLSPFGA